MTGRKGECDLDRPMLLHHRHRGCPHRHISPGVFRKEFAFEKWNHFDQDLFDTTTTTTLRSVKFDIHHGYDIDMKAVNTASLNVRAAGMSKDITIAQEDFKDFQELPKRASSRRTLLMASASLPLTLAPTK